MFLFLRRHRFDPSRRLLAAWLGVTVFALGLFAVSPELHQGLHAHEQTHEQACEHGHGAAPATCDDELCVVELFAGGVVAGLAALLLATVQFIPVAFFRPGVRVYLTSLPWRMPPGRAPPILM